MSSLDSPDPVHRAVMRHSLPELIQALASGENVDTIDVDNRTALFYAARDGELEIVDELVKRGALVNARDRLLETPLYFAVRGYRPEVVKMLLKDGADLTARDSNGNTPLWRAVFESRGREEVIQILLASGANKGEKNDHGVSPEQLAATIGNYRISLD